MSDSNPSRTPEPSEGTWQAEAFALVRQLFEDRIPFNQQLGLVLHSIGEEGAVLRFPFREQLVGNFARGSLHGGVISAALDTVGGVVAFLGVMRRLEGRSEEEKVRRLGKIGTIDLRVDYLRSGLGKEFFASGFVLRTGNKVAVTRMELHNQDESLLAVGTGTYIVG
jgi:uncharacterized protein (TIGR00369 family)